MITTGAQIYFVIILGKCAKGKSCHGLSPVLTDIENTGEIKPLVVNEALVGE